MPGSFIAAIVFAVILLAVIVARLIVGRVTARLAAAEEGSLYRLNIAKGWRLGLSIGSGVLSGLVVLLMVLASVTSIGTRDIGVLTSFGRPSGSLSNGLHWKAPWKKVSVLDGAIQTDSFTNAGKDCITVRIAHQATACVDVSIRWQITQGQADALFRNYRTFDHIRDSLVTRDLRSALNDQMETYDVLAVDGEGNSTAPPLSSVAKTVATELQTQIGPQGVNVLSIILPVMHFDDNTQGRLNDLQAQIAKTRVAQQAEQTATAQSAANKALAASVSNDPNVLVSKCLDDLTEAITKNYTLPAGFSCFGGSNVAITASGTAATK